MAGHGNLLVGMVGQGIFGTADGGDTWARTGVASGMHQNAVVRSLVAHPRDYDTVFCGCDRGIYRSEDRGRRWQLLDTALNGKQVWVMAIDPVDPNIMFAGTGSPRVPEIFRSRDGGNTWEKRPMDASESCAVGVPQMTSIVIDPADHNNIWVGIEIDGLRPSTDGGDTFRTVTQQVPDSQGNWIDDIHNLAISSGPPKTVYALVGAGGGHKPDMWTSTDDGETWNSYNAHENLPCVGEVNGQRNYPRGIAVKPGEPNTIFMSIGDNTPGRTGTVLRSRDMGQTWQNLEMPVPPNSAMWVVNVPQGDPSRVFAATRYGYLYRSLDGGDNWEKLWREFSEISSILWLPD